MASPQYYYDQTSIVNDQTGEITEHMKRYLAWNSLDSCVWSSMAYALPLTEFARRQEYQVEKI